MFADTARVTNVRIIIIIINHNTCFRLFSATNISQGTVAMHLRCGGIFYYRFAGNLLLSLSVKEF